MPRIFISHSTQDRVFIEQQILPALRSRGCELWYSTDDIHGADDWEKQIREGLTSCDWFLVVLSKSSVQSRWVKAEVNWAL
ncbi:MAG TPA: phosphopeptide-binding protein, partial [Planctomycetaceae bacterium]|nr:phosphopeptide-binding protein [Planctomycetaceae bacterium]